MSYKIQSGRLEYTHVRWRPTRKRPSLENKQSVCSWLGGGWKNDVFGMVFPGANDPNLFKSSENMFPISGGSTTKWMSFVWGIFLDSGLRRVVQWPEAFSIEHLCFDKEKSSGSTVEDVVPTLQKCQMSSDQNCAWFFFYIGDFITQLYGDCSYKDLVVSGVNYQPKQCGRNYPLTGAGWRKMP